MADDNYALLVGQTLATIPVKNTAHILRTYDFEDSDNSDQAEVEDTFELPVETKPPTFTGEIVVGSKTTSESESDDSHVSVSPTSTVIPSFLEPAEKSAADQNSDSEPELVNDSIPNDFPPLFSVASALNLALRTAGCTFVENNLYEKPLTHINNKLRTLILQRDDHLANFIFNFSKLTKFQAISHIRLWQRLCQMFCICVAVILPWMLFDAISSDCFENCPSVRLSQDGASSKPVFAVPILGAIGTATSAVIHADGNFLVNPQDVATWEFDDLRKFDHHACEYLAQTVKHRYESLREDVLARAVTIPLTRPIAPVVSESIDFKTDAAYADYAYNPDDIQWSDRLNPFLESLGNIDLSFQKHIRKSTSVFETLIDELSQLETLSTKMRHLLIPIMSVAYCNF